MVNSSKTVHSERASFTKAEREYVRGIIRNLSLQRFSDREIVQWLHDQKQIDLGRSTVSKIRNQLEKDSAKWFVELRESAPKVVAIYKGMLDSLLSYQKQLHEIMNDNPKPEIRIRAISELHRIEISYHDFITELPDFSVESMGIQPDTKKVSKLMSFHEWYLKDYSRNHFTPKIGNETDEENGKYYRELEKQYKEYMKGWKESKSNAWTIMDDDGEGLERPLCDGDTWLQCYGCHSWFRESTGSLRKHDCHRIFADFPMSIEAELTKFKFELDRQIESEAWTIDPPIPVPKSLVSASASAGPIEIEEKVVYDPPKEEQPKPQPVTTEEEEEEKPIQKDTIDVDVLGYSPKPFDVSDTWVQCKLYDCNKWFKNTEIRQKHAAKYHT